MKVSQILQQNLYPASNHMLVNPSSKTHIVYVVTKSSWGGAGRYVYDLATNLPKDQFQVTVISGGEGLLVERLNAKNIRTILVPELERDISFLKDTKVTNSLVQLFNQLQPDIVHLNSSKVGGLGALAARKAKIPKIIFTAHGWAFNENRGIVWKVLTYLASWVTALLVDTVITISYKEEAQALRFPFVSSKKLAMIYIGLGDRVFLSRKEARKYIQGVNKKTPDADAIWIGSIGELHKNKGHMYALEMCKSLKERGKKFFYLLIGEGEERNTLLEFIQKNDLAENVALLGPIPDSASGWRLLKAFDILLHPSTKEGLPYVLLEAGLAEISVVSTHVGGIPEIVSHNESGLLAGDITGEVLAELIERVMYDTRLQRDLAAKLKEKVNLRFSFEGMLEETMGLYKS